MNQDGSINFHKLEEFIEYQVSSGVDGLIACGTTGEGSTLDNEEHIAVTKKIIDVVNKRIPVIACTGSNDTNYGLQLSLEAKNMGADALLHITPYYNKASQKGLIEHFKYIAKGVDLPIILYNVPSRTGVNIKPETYSKLADIDNIVGIKEANGDISSLLETISLCGDKLDYYTGNDEQVIPFYSLGGKGVISVASNIIPKEVKTICNLCEAGKYKEATELQCKYLKLYNALFVDVNPIPIKEALNIAGFDIGECRLPLCRTDEKNIELLKNLLIELEII